MSYAAALARLPGLETALTASIAKTQVARVALRSARDGEQGWAAEDALRAAIAQECADAHTLASALASLGPLAQAELDGAVAARA